MDDAGERAIDVQVTRLRRKVEADPREPRFLHTVRGRGYVLKPGGSAWTPCAPCTVCGGRAFRHLTSEDGYDWEVCEHCDFVRLTARARVLRTGRHAGRDRAGR